MTTEGPMAGSVGGGEYAERFTHLRPLLFTTAYEILGSTMQSDDVLQDSYLRRSVDSDLHHIAREAVTLGMCVVSRGQTSSELNGHLPAAGDERG